MTDAEQPSDWFGLDELTSLTTKEYLLQLFRDVAQFVETDNADEILIKCRLSGTPEVYEVIALVHTQGAAYHGPTMKGTP